MTAWNPRANEIFLQAAEIDAPAERVALLDSSCADDADLRRQVEALLMAHDSAGSFLSTPAGMNSHGGETVTKAPGSTDEAGDGPELGFLAPPHVPGNLGRLGGYEVQSVVGSGGMGVVLKALDESLSRTVAIKVLNPQYAANATARRRFVREATAIAAVVHEHVVTIHAVKKEDPTPYIVMQFIGGVSLQERIDRSGPLGLKEVLRIGMQIASGLAAAHAQGIVHRDIKPANILLENGVERVKITDFGLARAVDDASVTQSGVIAGTPLFMSPEQAAGEPIDHRSDLFSLGSVLYAMCTGHAPFRAGGTMAVLKRVIEATPRPAREVNPEVPDWLDAIIQKLHAKDPAQRFQSAKELAQLLEQHLAHLQQPDQVALPPRVEPPAAGSVTPTKRKRLLRWVAALGMLLVLAYLLFWFGPAALRYLGNRGEVAFSADGPGLERIKVLRDGKPYTDFDPRTNPTMELPPGKYILKPVQSPGRAVNYWELSNWGMFNNTTEKRPGISGEFDLRRGRRVSIRALMHDSWWPAPVTNGFTALFNGRDLTGWKPDAAQPGVWRVEAGELVGRYDGPGYLFTERGDYRDFHLRAEAMISGNGNSGVLFRCEPRTSIDLGQNGGHIPAGYEADINLSPKQTARTGTLWRSGAPLQIISDSLVRPDTWFTLDVIAQGNSVQIKVDGKTVVDRVDPQGSPVREGHLGLQIAWPESSKVRFRQIEIKELK